MSLFSALPEDFLHFIWKTKSFDQKNLTTLSGEKIVLIDPGEWNHDQGPDFLHAKLKIDELDWFGHIEIHTHSKEWYAHGHHQDKGYNSTILHVVLESNGKQIFREDGSFILELSLKDRIDTALIKHYHQLQLSADLIPCGSQINRVELPVLLDWFGQLSHERLQAKAERIQQSLKTHIHDWEQILWDELLAYMGGTVNQAVFRELAERIPFKLIRPYRSHQVRAEALLFGAAGMLRRSFPQESYPALLKSEWEFLKYKHRLAEWIPLNIRFMRMRPAAFPTIRLSQLSKLLAIFPSIIKLLEENGMELLLNTEIKASSYWETHNRFGESSKKRTKKLGHSQKYALAINTLIPLTHLYHQAHGKEHTIAYALNLLKTIPAEHNRITRVYTSLGIELKDALTSQALIHLNKHYCDPKKCLQCAIGQRIMKR